MVFYVHWNAWWIEKRLATTPLSNKFPPILRQIRYICFIEIRLILPLLQWKSSLSNSDRGSLLSQKFWPNGSDSSRIAWESDRTAETRISARLSNKEQLFWLPAVNCNLWFWFGSIRRLMVSRCWIQTLHYRAIWPYLWLPGQRYRLAFVWSLSFHREFFVRLPLVEMIPFNGIHCLQL